MPGRGETVAQLEQRLKDGEWLAPGLAAEVLEVSRTTIHAWLAAGQTPGPEPLPLRHRRVGTHRRCHPEDVLAILAKHREVHGTGD